MSNNNSKPLYVQVAEKLTAELKAGTSPFQKPMKDNGMPAFVKPVNPFSGKGYSALNALNLSLQGYDDPRWMSAKDASYNKFWVAEGSKGTLINFPKRNDIEAVRNVDGGKIKGEDGKTQTRFVEFEKTQNGKAKLFNATQVNEFPPLADFLEKQEAAERLLPAEKAEKLIADSGAVIIHGGQEAHYDKLRDVIFLPEKEQFENETKYYQAAIHQLAHWTGHESRLNRPMEGKLGSMEYGKEELRAATAAMLIGGELKIGHNFGHHAAYSGGWAKMLKDNPYEIARATMDVQKMTALLLGIGKKIEQKKSTAPNTKLTKGEEIAYNNTTYTIVDKKGKNLIIEKADTGEKFTVKPTDKLIGKLVEARNNPVAPKQEQEHENEPELETEQTVKIGR
jgi:antirestriction protein ArdC